MDPMACTQRGADQSGRPSRVRLAARWNHIPTLGCFNWEDLKRHGAGPGSGTAQTCRHVMAPRGWQGWMMMRCLGCQQLSTFSSRGFYRYLGYPARSDLFQALQSRWPWPAPEVKRDRRDGMDGPAKKDPTVKTAPRPGGASCCQSGLPSGRTRCTVQAGAPARSGEVVRR